jgi:hypothetical protein
MKEKHPGFVFVFFCHIEGCFQLLGNSFEKGKKKG